MIAEQTQWQEQSNCSFRPAKPWKPNKIEWWPPTMFLQDGWFWDLSFPSTFSVTVEPSYIQAYTSLFVWRTVTGATVYLYIWQMVLTEKTMGPKTNHFIMDQSWDGGACTYLLFTPISFRTQTRKHGPFKHSWDTIVENMYLPFDVSFVDFVFDLEIPGPGVHLHRLRRHQILTRT